MDVILWLCGWMLVNCRQVAAHLAQESVCGVYFLITFSQIQSFSLLFWYFT